MEKVVQMWAISVILKKTVSNKQPPNGRKFAQSGHPGPNVKYVFP
jgi:hypothetical protein